MVGQIFVMNTLSIFWYFDDEVKIRQFKEELMEYLGSFSFVINDIEQNETALQFWIVSGKAKYPVLGEVALRIHQVPTSAAASERAWNIFDHIHTKRRNRLLNERVHKLAFVMINRSFRNDSNPIIAEEFDF